MGFAFSHSSVRRWRSLASSRSLKRSIAWMDRIWSSFFFNFVHLRQGWSGLAQRTRLQSLQWATDHKIAAPSSNWANWAKWTPWTRFVKLRSEEYLSFGFQHHRLWAHPGWFFVSSKQEFEHIYGWQVFTAELSTIPVAVAAVAFACEFPTKTAQREPQMRLLHCIALISVQS